MILLNKALLAGLARGKKLFAGVKNNIERLSNAGDDGFLGEVDLTQPAELYVCPECTEPTVTKQRDNSFSCSNCMMMANEGDELMLASDEDKARWHTHENGVAPTEPVSMGYGWDGGTELGKGAKGSKIPPKPSAQNADEYPHDILPNKKDGLGRGVSKYGNKKGER